MSKSRSNSERKGSDKHFWTRLREIAVPAGLGWESGDGVDPKIRVGYEKHFEHVERRLEHLKEYAIDDVEETESSVRPQVLYLMMGSEVGYYQRIDGILFKGQKYYEKFMSASDLDATVMWNYDDIPYVSFVNPEE